MSNIDQYEAYATTFTAAFKAKDWSLLNPFFTDDAEYKVSAGLSEYSRQASGIGAVLEDFQTSTDNLDQLFDKRIVESIGGPEERPDGVVWARWRATYQKNGVPDLIMEGEETAVFDEVGKIKSLEETVSEDTCNQVLNYFDQNKDRFKKAKA